MTQDHNKNELSGYGLTNNNNVAGNLFEDNFYIDSVERYNVKYKPPAPPAISDSSKNNRQSVKKQTSI